MSIPKDNPLLGTWRLIRWYNVPADGTRIFPLGEDASGYISYSEDGFVFVHMSAANRALFAINDPFGGTPEEESAAAKSHISYAGPFAYRGDEVVHRVTQASCPNWVGSEQVRRVRFEGDKLELSAVGVLFQGQVITAYVLWERASAVAQDQPRP
ncbi:MAG: lipocalin-like domain-containing protein [Magnetospiraceae bacterium]